MNIDLFFNHYTKSDALWELFSTDILYGKKVHGVSLPSSTNPSIVPI